MSRVHYHRVGKHSQQMCFGVHCDGRDPVQVMNDDLYTIAVIFVVGVFLWMARQ